MKALAIDFEFNKSREPKLNLVCAVVYENDKRYDFNLLYYEEIQELKRYLLENKDSIIVSFGATSEARSFQALGLNPLDFKWIDLYSEWRMLCNSNDKYNYGEYIEDDNIYYSYPINPKVEDGKNHKEVPKNLLNCVYKLIGEQISSKVKDEMRNLIISEDELQIEKSIEEIINYCAEDTKYLIPLYKKFIEIYDEFLVNFHEDMLQRGRYAAATGMIESEGIPIDVPLLNKIIDKTPEILKVFSDEVNKYFTYFVPEIQKPDLIVKKGEKYKYGNRWITAGKDIHKKYKPIEAKKDMSSYQKYVTTLNFTDFPTTDGGKFSKESKVLDEWRVFDSGLEALYQYNKLESNLKWFNKDSKKGSKAFWDSFGSDNRVRPFFGIFGTQTGRNAAKASTFPPAMSSWLRCIMAPPSPESSIIGADFSQQEVYVAGILSQDNNLIDAYNSGDVYTYFGKLTGVIPPEGNKETHEKERDLFKSTVLGKQFGMGCKKLHIKLINDSKNKNLLYSVAEDMDKYHKDTFKEYWNWVYKISNDYKSKLPLITNDGFVLWSDNPVLTSVRNFPVQGNSASITRLAVIMCVERGLKVLFQLHDAIYLLTDNVNRDKIILEEIMKEATRIVLHEEKTNMRVDFKIVKYGEPWIEKKGKEYYNKIKKFL